MISTRALRDSITLYFSAYPGGSGSGETDRYGAAIRQETQGVDVRAHVEPFRLTTEELATGDRREDRVKVFVSPELSVDGLSRFEWHSASYEVYGEPGHHRGRNGAHHLEFLGRRVLGG